MSPILRSFLLATTILAPVGAQAFSDGFEGPILDSFWTAFTNQGTVTVPSPVLAHTGNHSLQLDTGAVSSASVKNAGIRHQFAGPRYGSLSVWMYDSNATAASSNYINLYAAPFGVGTFDYIVSPTNGGNYVYTTGGNHVHSNIPKSQGWHRFQITSSPNSATISIDGVVVYTGPGQPFTEIQLEMHAPGWRPAWLCYFDDFDFIPLSPAASYSLFGAGCVGSNGTPNLQAPSSPPILGGPFELIVGSLPAISTAFGMYGFTDSQLPNGTPLPLPLGYLGMQGCSLFVSADVIVYLGNRPTPTTASWVTSLPLLPALAGTSLFQQAFVIDPGINPFNATMSNPGRADLGW